MAGWKWFLWIVIGAGLIVSLEPGTEKGPYTLKNENMRKIGGNY
jgi:hypothetical protein